MTYFTKPAFTHKEALDMINNAPVFKDLTHREDRPVLGYYYNHQKFAVKFSMIQQARRHEGNTALFQHFGMPFVSCQAVQIDPNTCSDPIHHMMKSTHATGIVIMPYVEGDLLPYHISNKPDPLLAETPGYKLALDFAPNAIAGSYLHAKPQNIKIQTEPDGKMSAIFLDARIGGTNYAMEYEWNERVKDVLHQETRDYLLLFDPNITDKPEVIAKAQKNFSDFSKQYLPKTQHMFPENLKAIAGFQQGLVERVNYMGQMKIVDLF